MNLKPRGTLARSIYDKFHNDQYLEEYDKRLWYTLDSELIPGYQNKFVALKEPDKITYKWLDQTRAQSVNIWRHIWHSIARSVLHFFMTQTDINGFLKRGSMFILSEQQFEVLLRAGGFKATADNITILDIGAGDGEITLRLMEAVININNHTNIETYATEVSWTMRERLRKHNFCIIDYIKDIRNIELISCLNVLDRCIDPLELLEDIYNALAPSGRAIVALVLPYVHYVEFNSSHLPLRPLMNHWPDRAKHFSFEIEATLFFEKLEMVGFEIQSWTKAPYLCEGDLKQSFYWLIDIVVVLSKKLR